MHRLLAQNREMLVMIQRLMSQVSDKYAKENNEPLNETWILSELSQNFSLNSNSNLFTDLNASSNLLGSNTIDFSSQVFDNSNLGLSPLHRNMNAGTGMTGLSTSAASSPFKGTFNDPFATSTITSSSSNQNGGFASMMTSTAETDIGTNVKATNPFATDAYRIAFDNTLSSTTSHAPPHSLSMAGTSTLTSDLFNNNKTTLIQ